MNAVRTSLAALRADWVAANGRSGAGTLASVWTFDETLPASLAARWAGADSNGILFADFTRTMVNSGAFVVLLGSMAGLAAGTGSPLMWAWLAAAAIVALILGWLSHRRSRRRGSFTAQEIDLIVKNRREVSFRDWDGFNGPNVPREVTAARRADQLARSVLAVRGWSSEQLAGHRIRLDAAGEAAAIRLAARELYDLRCQLETAAAGDRSIRELDTVRAEWSKHLEASWSALDGRITAFDQYVTEVTEVAGLIEQSETAKRLTASLDEHGPQLSVQTVCSEMATSHLQDLRSELRVLESRLRCANTLHPGMQVQLDTDTK